jgi:hypothetical protein
MSKDRRQRLIDQILREVPRDQLMVAAGFLIDHQNGNTVTSTDQLSRPVIFGKEVNEWLETLTINQLMVWRDMAKLIRKKPEYNQ